MRYSTVLSRLQNLINREITQAELCRVLNVKQSTMGNRQNRDSNFSEEEIAELNNYYSVDIYTEITKSDDTEYITLDYYPDIEVSCGNGIIPFGETKEKMTVPVSLIKGYSKNKKYVIVNATSDSMQPEIKPNDMLIIRVTDTDTIIDNHIYVFCYEDRLYCKYLSYNVNQIIVRSANKDYPTRFIEKENINDFILCGEVCGHFRSYLR